MVPGDQGSPEGMVCVAEDSYVLVIVRDMSSGSTTVNKISLELPSTTLVSDLMIEVAKKFFYEPNSFELLLQRHSDAEQVILNDVQGDTLEGAGFAGNNSRNSVIISQLGNVPPRRVEAPSNSGAAEDDLKLGASASPTAGGDNLSYMNPAPLLPLVCGDYSYTPGLIKQDTGYVGLVNQAMTCYLNSLLQALFMTPEFRNALYNWEFDGSEEDGVKSIPYQLQKLFLQLQTSTKSAVETTELTKSFGWDSSEAWQQHDIQELCRVMFDALEQKFKNTEQADLISRLYEGKMIDYVKCLECSTEKSREDTFLDIPLPVRPFGSNVAYGSVEEALRAFVQPEILDGNNQYFCENCNKKCDAHKGLKFSKFPYLLTLHLKRFDFDYNTLHRIKLNDKVVFPELLNLNSFIKSESKESEEETSAKCDDSSTTDSGSALDDESCHGGTEGATNSHEIDCQEDDEGIDVSNGPNHQENEKNRRHSLEKGPYNYELFSIMVHSGSASGGHYYAYIKDFRHGEWYCFNDQSVTRITYDDIRKTYGGGPTRGYYSGAYSSSTNAYMLMYRQIDKKRNVEAKTVTEFPAHISKLLQRMQEKEEQDRVAREKERHMCKMKLYVRHPTQNRLAEDRLHVHKDLTLAEVTELAYKQLELEGFIPLDRCRLVHYDQLQDSIECSFEGREDEPIAEVMSSVRGNYKWDLLLEMRHEGQEFEVYQPGGVTVKVFVVDLVNEEVQGPHVIRGYLAQTVADFKKQLGRQLALNPAAMRIVLEKYSNEPQLLEFNDKTLKMEGFYGSNKVYVEDKDVEDSQNPYFASKLQKVIDRFEHIITLQVVLPDTDPDTLHQMGIPPLTQTVNQDCDGVREVEGDDLVRVVEREEDNASPIAAESPKPDTGGGSDPEDEGIGDLDSGPGATSAHSDQSTSEDSSLTDSDRTLIGESQDDCLAHVSSGSNSPHGSEEQNVSSPEERNATDKLTKYIPEASEKWDEEESPPAREIAVKKYFKVVSQSDSGTDEKILKVLVDKRTILGALKKELEPYVGVSQEYFKIYRIYSSNQEFECARLSESLSSYRDDGRLIVKLGRVLRKGEHRGKVYQLVLNDSEPFKFLCDWILAKGMTVERAKREILAELKAKCGLDLPFERCRLRKKSWKTPGQIFLNDQRFEEDIIIFSNWEMFVQELPGPDPVMSTNQMILFIRQWHPSTLMLDPFDEIVFETASPDLLKEKLSDMSGIPAERIEIAKGQGTFPCEMSVLGIHSDLEWVLASTGRDLWPFNILEDGYVVYFRDSQEELKQLSDEERKEIVEKENARFNKLSTSNISSYSPRKEKALKIYLDTPPQSKVENEVD